GLIGCRVQMTRFHERAQRVRMDVFNVARARAQRRDLARIFVVPGNAKARPCELHDERQTHVADTDDDDPPLAPLDLLDQVHSHASFSPISARGPVMSSRAKASSPTMRCSSDSASATVSTSADL